MSARYCGLYQATLRVASPLRDAGQLQHVGVAAEKALVGTVQMMDGLAHNFTRLVVELLRRWAEHRLEDRDKLRGELLNGGLVVLIYKQLAGNSKGR